MLSGCLIEKWTRSNKFEHAEDIQVMSQEQRGQEGQAAVCMCKCNKFGSREQKICYTETTGMMVVSWQPFKFC